MLILALMEKAEELRYSLYILVCLELTVFTHQGVSFNFDLINYNKHTGPEGSYFGFAVDFYKANDTNVNVVVGAPKNDVGPSQGGSVFMCPWTPTLGQCQKLNFDHTGDENLTSPYIGSKLLTTHKFNQWLGATVRTFKTCILACAPLFHWNVIEGTKEAMKTPVGNCQLLNMLSGDVSNYAPCRDYELEEVYQGRKGYGDRRYCEAGFSSDITQDGRVVLGAPGGFFFQGQIITASLEGIMAAGGSFSPIHFMAGETKTLERFDHYDIYLGYSVATGHFDADGVPDYVVGVPNDLNTAGSIKVLSGSSPYHKMMRRLGGFQIASYFGHCVAVTDINSDGRDDILVGAPLFMEPLSSQKLREVGQVYIYLQHEGYTFNPAPTLILTGKHAYGRFGSTIAPLGDIDIDGFNDVAVGAPGSGEGGWVYIYMGQRDGLNPQYVQVIESPFTSPAPAFGFSLRGGTDIDGNGYPDLIVGAWGADSVAIYRTKAVVKTKAQLSFFPDFLNPDDQLCQLGTTMHSCFTIMMCISVSGYRIPENIELTAELQLDKLKPNMARRTVLRDSSQSYSQFNLSVNRDIGTACQNFTAYLLAEFRDKLSPIFISLNYSLVNSHGAMLHGQKMVVGQTQIVLDCGDDNICIPDLKLTAKAGSEPLLIGDENPALLIIQAENKGEGAYETELHVRLPPQTHYQGVLSDREGFTHLLCVPKKDNGTVIVVCELGNPMKAGKTLHAGLYFSTGGLEEVESHVTFHLQMKSKNSQNPDSESVEVRISIQAKASLELRGFQPLDFTPAALQRAPHPVLWTGKGTTVLTVPSSSTAPWALPVSAASCSFTDGVSSPAECVLPIAKWIPKPSPESLDDVGPVVEHVYELRNKGPSPVNARLRLDFPVQHNGSELLYVFSNASEELLSCHTDHTNIDPLGLVKVEEINTTAAVFHHINKREIQQQQHQQQHQDQSVQLRRETVHVNCSSGEFCVSFVCEAAALQRDGRAVVRVAARLWVNTFLQRPYVNYVLQSSAYYEVVNVPSKIQLSISPSGQAATNTSVIWRRPDGQEEVPVWWIVVSIIAGLLLLAMLSIIFWKVGFFKRNRPPNDDDDYDDGGGDDGDNKNPLFDQSESPNAPS